jgi:hypothetical protein
MMINKIKTIILEPKTSKALLNLRFSGYLKDIGWFNAFKNKKPLDSKNQPIPWVSYPFINFIEKRLNKSYDIFEFGSGYSTLYYAERVKSVTSVEHDKDWYQEIKSTMPTNVNLIYQELNYDGDYCRTTGRTQEKYDLIVVDGRDRVNCVRYSLGSLKEGGVIILDNSDRDEYVNAYQILAANHFKNIEFWGLAPGFLHTTCTTVFYQSSNCLGI